MEAIELKCPCCGSNLDINYEKIIKCTYCGVSLINPLMKDEKNKKKDLRKNIINNIKEIEDEIYKIRETIDIEGNATWRSNQEQFYYGYPTKKGTYRSSSNTRVVSGVYITDEMLEKENGLYMFDEKEQEYIRYYIFCARTLSDYTKLFTEYDDTKQKELIGQMDLLFNNFIKEKKKMEEPQKVNEKI